MIFVEKTSRAEVDREIWFSGLSVSKNNRKGSKTDPVWLPDLRACDVSQPGLWSLALETDDPVCIHCNLTPLPIKVEVSFLPYDLKSWSTIINVRLTDQLEIKAERVRSTSGIRINLNRGPDNLFSYGFLESLVVHEWNKLSILINTDDVQLSLGGAKVNRIPARPGVVPDGVLVSDVEFAAAGSLIHKMVVENDQERFTFQASPSANHDRKIIPRAPEES